MKEKQPALFAQSSLNKTGGESGAPPTSARKGETMVRQMCDAIIEIDLTTGEYRRPAAEKSGGKKPRRAKSYEKIFNWLIGRAIHPADVSPVKSALSIDGLRKALRGGKKQVSARFRVNQSPENLLWLECSAVFAAEKQKPLAYILTRDISAFKEQEFIHEQYTAALRNIYDESYEFNITQNAYRTLHCASGVYARAPKEGRLNELLLWCADQIIHPDDAARFIRFFSLSGARKLIFAEKAYKIEEFRRLCTDRTYRWTSATLFPLKTSACADERYVCFIMDIEEKKRAEEIERQVRELKRQRQDDARYRIVAEQAGTIVFEWIRDDNYRFISKRMPELLAGNYDGRNLFQLWKEDRVIYEKDLRKFESFLKKATAEENYTETTVRLLSKTGRYVWYKLALTCALDENGKPRRLFGALNDVDETTRSRKRLADQAEADALTGIYNEGAFYARAKELMDASPELQFAVVRMDINRFKLINDIYGMEEGDKLLKYVAGVFRQNLSGKFVYGRINSDVFCFCGAFMKEEELTERIEKIALKIEEYGLGYTAVPSFGVCVAADRAMPVSILCDWANLALKTIKGNARRKWAFYDDSLRAKQLDEQKIEHEMEKALDGGQFVIYLQPKHDVRSCRVVGAEALVRWNHPHEGVISPFRFISLFEKNGFIIRLDEYVWESVCKLLKNWLDQGYRAIPISLNVSRIHVYSPAFETKLIALLEKYRLPARLIELEMSESTLTENPGELYRKMNALRKKGFRFSIDDFGSGYSSLQLLKNTPVNTIKFNREFLNESTATKKGKTVAQHMIALADELDIDVIAEGVETKEQADFLMQSGCVNAQGFYFSKPMPAEQFERWYFQCETIQDRAYKTDAMHFLELMEPSDESAERNKLTKIRKEIKKRFYPSYQIGQFKVGRGFPDLNGATMLPGCVNFTVYSSRAAACELVIYKTGDAEPFAVIPFPEEYRIGAVFSMLVFVSSAENYEYGFRVEGPRQGAIGDRFDKTKTLLDAYACIVSGRDVWGAKPDWSKPFQYRANIASPMFDWEGDRRLNIAHSDLIIYEMHLRGFTRHPSSNVRAGGTYNGLKEKISYLKLLGINAIEFLPIFEFDEQEFSESSRTDPDGNRLCNYWGYSTVAFFAPKAGYAEGGVRRRQANELKELIKELHRNGIKVILDVVFNHTAEGNERGPYFSFKGLDNRTYYILTPEGAYKNYSGCGNTLNCNHPVVRAMILNCLRYWTNEYHVDGFRFDLAAILGRDQNGAPMANPPLLESLAFDPMLSESLLIAEAWDAGGLYQVGSFPSFGKWSEWNGKYRDDMRRFLKGDEGLAAAAAHRLTGSTDLYDPASRGKTASINFITCHDGFTLYDLYAYNEKHNEKNGWNNTDGTNDNFSWNCGAEGDTDDKGIIALRKKMIKNAVSVLFCSHGIPMFLAGDEFCNTQFGNNNPYCQDNEISWLDWDMLRKNHEIFDFFRKMIAFRKAHPTLRNAARPCKCGCAETSWHGVEPWMFDNSSTNRVIAVMFAGYVETEEKDEFIYLAANVHWESHQIRLPQLPKGHRWRIFSNTAMPAGKDICEDERKRPEAKPKEVLQPRSVMIFTA